MDQVPVEVRGGSGVVFAMAAAGWACNNNTLYAVDLVDGTLRFTAQPTDAEFQYLCGTAPLRNGRVAAVDMMSRSVLISDGRDVEVVARGPARGGFRRDGPRDNATFYRPRAVVAVWNDDAGFEELIVADGCSVRLVSEHRVDTLQTLASQITAVSASALGRHTVVAGTKDGRVVVISRSCCQVVAKNLGGAVDALLVTSAHVAVASVTAPRSFTTFVYAINLCTGQKRIVSFMHDRSNIRGSMLAWDAGRVVAVAHQAHVLRWAAPGRPVIRCTHWKQRGAWSERGGAAARTAAMAITRRHQTAGGVGLPRELVGVGLWWLWWVGGG